MDSSLRINKYLALHGYATRRGADALIASGRVRVNGKVAVIGQKVSPTDTVDVQTEGAKKLRYILYYKPAGILTHAESDNSANDLLRYAQKKNGIKGLFPVGRLDKDTEGLIILTDDGRLTTKLSQEETPMEQEYEVTVDKRVTGTFMNRLAKGVRLDKYMTKPAQVTAISERVFAIALSEGRKHHIRRMCSMLGYAVLGLKRTRIGSLELKALTPGSFHELSKKEVVDLYTTLGLR